MSILLVVKCFDLKALMVSYYEHAAIPSRAHNVRIIVSLRIGSECP